MGSTSFGEREPLLSPKTDETIEILSIRQALLKKAQKVAQRNIGLLLIVAAQAFFAVVDAAVKILQSVDPPVTTFPVRLKPHYQLSRNALIFLQALDYSNDNHLYRLHDIHVHTLSQLDTPCF